MRLVASADAQHTISVPADPSILFFLPARDHDSLSDCGVASIDRFLELLPVAEFLLDDGTQPASRSPGNARELGLFDVEFSRNVSRASDSKLLELAAGDRLPLDSHQ